VHEASREVHLPTGHETVLFVEDELAIAHMCKEMLEMLGYKVIICANGIEALELFKINPNMYDLVITDMTMPKMNGSELAKKLMSIRADIPIIMCTGYSHNISEEKAKSEGIRELIIKPYDSWDIALTIRNVLDRPDQEGRYSR
jgi:CheY-like chemotaxis protein